MTRDTTSNLRSSRFDQLTPLRKCSHPAFHIGAPASSIPSPQAEPSGVRINLRLEPPLGRRSQSPGSPSHLFNAHRTAQRFTPTHF
jgi:hypothetical protein